MTRCPGFYCGRNPLPDGSFGDCGSCLRGYKVNESHFCVPCNDKPTNYDWLFLTFTVMVPLIFQFRYIDSETIIDKMNGMYVSAIIEVFYSALCTLLIMNPVGTFSLTSCHVSSLADWYTLLFNPSPNYEDTVYCTQEAVYPLYSMIFIFYALNVLMLILIRPWFIRKSVVDVNTAKRTFYAALYLYPILAVIHAVFGGIIYYSFPYITLVISMIANAGYFANIRDQSASNLIMTTVKKLRNIVVVLTIWICNMFGIIGIIPMQNSVMNYMLLLIAPLPTIFYILTSKFTDPRMIYSE